MVSVDLNQNWTLFTLLHPTLLNDLGTLESWSHKLYDVGVKGLELVKGCYFGNYLPSPSSYEIFRIREKQWLNDGKLILKGLLVSPYDRVVQRVLPLVQLTFDGSVQTALNYYVKVGEILILFGRTIEEEAEVHVSSKEGEKVVCLTICQLNDNTPESLKSPRFTHWQCPLSQDQDDDEEVIDFDITEREPVVYVTFPANRGAVLGSQGLVPSSTRTAPLLSGTSFNGEQLRIIQAEFRRRSPSPRPPAAHVNGVDDVDYNEWGRVKWFVPGISRPKVANFKGNEYVYSKLKEMDRALKEQTLAQTEAGEIPTFVLPEQKFFYALVKKVYPTPYKYSTDAYVMDVCDETMEDVRVRICTSKIERTKGPEIRVGDVIRVHRAVAQVEHLDAMQEDVKFMVLSTAPHKNYVVFRRDGNEVVCETSAKTFTLDESQAQPILIKLFELDQRLLPYGFPAEDGRARTPQRQRKPTASPRTPQRQPEPTASPRTPQRQPEPTASPRTPQRQPEPTAGRRTSQRQCKPTASPGTSQRQPEPTASPRTPQRQREPTAGPRTSQRQRKPTATAAPGTPQRQPEPAAGRRTSQRQRKPTASPGTPQRQPEPAAGRRTSQRQRKPTASPGTPQRQPEPAAGRRTSQRQRKPIATASPVTPQRKPEPTESPRTPQRQIEVQIDAISSRSTPIKPGTSRKRRKSNDSLADQSVSSSPTLSTSRDLNTSTRRRRQYSPKFHVRPPRRPV